VINPELELLRYDIIYKQSPMFHPHSRNSLISQDEFSYGYLHSDLLLGFTHFFVIFIFAIKELRVFITEKPI